MGLPVKHRKKYVSHKKRWDKQTIVEESKLTQDYGLKNKNEIRKIEFMVSKFKGIAKQLNTTAEASSGEDAKRFIAKLKERGFVPENSESLDDVLDIKVRNVLERRLSNILYKHKLARTPTQARQFIVHGHVIVGGKVVNSPSYLVSLTEELTVGFKNTSILADENHPERNHQAQVLPIEEEVVTKEEVVESDDDNEDEDDE